MITQKQNRAHIYFALILLTMVGLVITIFSGCRPSYQTCQRLYPVQYKDTTNIKKDSVQVPFFIMLPGDTIYLTSNINKPCPDSIAQWQKFTDQLNFILGQNKKYKQTIDFQNNVFTSKLTIANDSVLKYKTLYYETIEKLRTQIMPVVSYVYKPSTWSWWSLGLNIFFLLAIGCAIVLKVSK